MKSSMGLMSRKVSRNPCSVNQRNESRWMAIRSGSGWTSPSVAKEKRSLTAGREGKAYSSGDGDWGFRGAPERTAQLSAERRGGHGNRSV